MTNKLDYSKTINAQRDTFSIYENNYKAYQLTIQKQNKEIERLKEQLSDEIDEELKQSEIMVKKQQEIERLKNIVNEFDKWLIGEQMMFYRSNDDERLIRYNEIKNKWVELKGEDKDYEN